MSRSRKQTETDTDESDSQLEKKVEQLADAVTELTDEAKVLRTVMDELRSEVVWAVRNGRLHSDPSSQWLVRLRSMPTDPTAADWSERVNIESVEVPTPTRNAGQRHYCCTNPQLEWLGDPGVPSIACANCGYVVAEEGQRVLYSAPMLGDDGKDANRDDAADVGDGPQQSFLWPASARDSDRAETH